MSKKSSNKIFIGAYIAAAALGAATLAATASHKLCKKLVDIALNRNTPKNLDGSRHKISGSYLSDPKTLKIRQAEYERLENSGCKTVKITAHDGEKLVGHLHICENAKRTVIAMHGWRSSWLKDFSAISEFLNDNQCNVLYAEQRGQNESGGDYMGFGLIERYDCLDWIMWVNAQEFSDLPIYLSGVSMGATTVLMAAGLELPQNVHGIVADCGFTSPHEIWKHVTENNLHIRYNSIRARIVSDMCKKKIQAAPTDYSATDAMKKCKIPVLFIHGTDDKFVPVEMTYENYKACSAQKRLLIVPGAKHGESYFVDKKAYEAAVIDFWKEFD